MSNLTIRQAVQGMLKLQDSGDHATMVGIGPMSPNLIQAVFELAKDEDFPPMFIASRNQVDMDEMGAGYVNGWDQTRFAADIKKVADEVGYTGPYYLCRDHGGPWQRDEERNAHLPEDEAMELARKSFVADMEAGFDLRAVPSVFMGGGAAIFKHRVSEQDRLCRPIYLTDVHANAAGYERIVGQMRTL